MSKSCCMCPTSRACFLHTHTLHLNLFLRFVPQEHWLQNSRPCFQVIIQHWCSRSGTNRRIDFVWSWRRKADLNLFQSLDGHTLQGFRRIHRFSPLPGASLSDESHLHSLYLSVCHSLSHFWFIKNSSCFEFRNPSTDLVSLACHFLCMFYEQCEMNTLSNIGNKLFICKKVIVEIELIVLDRETLCNGVLIDTKL